MSIFFAQSRFIVQCLNETSKDIYTINIYTIK